VAAGDINGDDTDDLIIGACYASYGSGFCSSGPVGGETYVIYGGPSVDSTIDLSSTSADITVHGDNADDWAGRGVAAGDVNGDDTDDLIIGAYGADPPGGTDAGKTYVIFGGPSLDSTIDLGSTSADVTVYGDDESDYSSLENVAAGDINGDGSDDLVIGSQHADPGGRTDAGETYVIYGGPSLAGTIDLDSTSADVTVYGDGASDRSAVSVGAGDIYGDGTDDLIIGAHQADPGGRTNAGKTYVIYGGSSLDSTIDLSSTSTDATVYGDDGYDYSGVSVAAGDINGDGTDDLIIGAYCAGSGCTGKTYVIYGDEAPVPVGGIAELPHVFDPSGPNYIALAGLAAAALAAVTAGAWYARRRWLG
jgi:hypothetical protein